MEADPMRGFIEERITFHRAGDDLFTPRTDIYGAYSAWAALNGFSAMSAQRFYEALVMVATDMSQHPIRTSAQNGVRGFVGISLKN